MKLSVNGAVMLMLLLVFLLCTPQQCLTVSESVSGIAPSPGSSGPQFNAWFFGTTRVYPPIGILIGSADFAELTKVTNSQSHQPCYSVCRDNPHLVSD